MSIEQFAEALIGRLDKIITLLSPKLPPARIVLGLPLLIRNGKIMANIELKNDVVEWIPIWTVNSVGTLELAPAGDVFSVAMGAPASQSGSGAPLNAVIGVMPSGDMVGAVALGLNALNKVAAGIPITVSDSAGLTVYTNLVDIVADVTPTAVTLDLPGAVMVPQPVPAA
jgi:hypothetical protein